MPAYEVVIKKISAQRVAAIRDTIATYSQQDRLWGELEGYLAQQGFKPTGPCFTVYYDPEYRERDVDTEVCETVDASARGAGRVQVRELPAVEMMASVVHHGSLNTLNQAYNALMQWIQANGYRIVGPNREVYVHTGSGEVRQDDPSYVVEVQFPVERV